MLRTTALAAVAAIACAAAAPAATLVAPVNVFWNNVSNGVAGAVPADRASIPGATLGAKDDKFFSLGLGNFAIFDFGGMFSIEGLIVEVTNGCNGPERQNGTCNYTETAQIFGLTQDQFNPLTDTLANVDVTAGDLIANVPNGVAQSGLSFGIAGTYRWLAVLDTSPFVASDPKRDGFDIDRIAVAPVPAPAALGLLAGAFGLLGALRARRRA